MVSNLYKLYRKSTSDRNLLEDYNTECFSGVLGNTDVHFYSNNQMLMQKGILND